MKKYFVSLACIALLCIALLCIAGMTAQEEAPKAKPNEASEDQKFKVKTELMEVRAVVTDRKGEMVENLNRDDFELLENDQEQKVSFFSISQVERERRQTAAAKTAVQENAVEPQSVQQRLIQAPVRTTLLYVDNLHLSFSSLNSVKQALRRFMDERVTDQDMVALVPSSGTLGIAQQFTRNRQILRYAIEQIRLGPIAHSSFFTPSLAARVINEVSTRSAGASGSTLAAEASRLRTEASQAGGDLGRLTPNMATSAGATRLAVDIIRRENNIYCPCSLVRAQAQMKAMQVLSEASFARKNTLAVLRDFSEQMMNLPGKRMIVVFSDGFTSFDGSGDQSFVETQAAINRAVRSGVVIYSIDAKGVQTPPTIDASRNQASAAYDCGEDPVDVACLPPDPESLVSTVSESEREELNGLHSIAQDTGGKLFNDTNNLGDALGRAFDANRFYYVLSYYPQAGNDARKFRNVKVRIRNHPEYTVRAARGFAPSEATAKPEDNAVKTPQQRLLRAMNLPLPLTDLAVSAQADFVETEGDDKQATLTVYFDGDKFQYREQDQSHAVELEILYAIYDASGKQVDGISAHVEGKLSSERLQQAKTSGYRFSRRVTLKPGSYQARIGVREEGTDRMGTASAWVEVPELAPAKLQMSSLMLRNPLDANPPEREGIHMNELEQIKMVQGIPLYARNDFCDYSFRVYEGSLTPASSNLLLMKELLRDGKPIKQEPWRPISADDKNKDKKGWFDLDGDVELSGFTPGVYELRISVKNSATNNPVQRSAVFGVE
jgi:VWFA-related protein